MSYPECCKSCPLLNEESYYRAQPEFHRAHLNLRQPVGKGVLVLVPDFGFKDGTWQCKEKPYNFLKSALDGCQMPYAVVPVARCAPNYELKPAKATGARQLCHTFFFDPDLERVSRGFKGLPAAILAVGEEAYRALFPDSALTLAKARQGIHYYECYDPLTMKKARIPVIPTNHPALQFKSYDDKGKDLTSEYTSSIGLVERISLGTDKLAVERVDCSAESFDDLQEWATLHHYAEHEYVAFDIETHVNENAPDWRSAYHPGSYVVCYSLCWGDSERKYAVSLYTKGMDSLDIYEQVSSLLEGKRVDGVNLLYDFSVVAWARGAGGGAAAERRYMQMVLAFADRDEYRTHFDDAFLWRFCQDQGQIGNGLAAQWQELFRLGNPKIEIEELMAQLLKKNPLGGFGDLPREKVEKYNRDDVFETALICDRHRPGMEDVAHPRANIYRMLLDETHAAACITLRGIAVDVPYFVQLKAKVEASIEKLDQWLQAHPLAQYVGGHINSKSPQKLSKLAKICIRSNPAFKKVFTKENKSGLSTNKVILKKACAVPGKLGGFWRTIQRQRNLRDNLSKFILGPIDHAFKDGDSYVVHYSIQIAKADVVSKNSDFGTGGIDSGRWATYPSVNNIIKNPVIRVGYIVGDCG